MNKYEEMKKKHNKDMGNITMFFAFSDKQFDEGMKSIGLKINDFDKIVRLEKNCFLKKEDQKKMVELLDRQRKELKENLNNEMFFKDALNYELRNHEYNITGEVNDALDAIGLTKEQITKDKNKHEWYKEVVKQWN